MNFNLPVNTFYANSIDAYIPQVWARESLIMLYENLVAAKLVYRDFSDAVADHGDTVNTRRPQKFEAIRKDVNDDVTTQDAVATNVPVVLNQLPHVSFIIRDAQASKSFKDLVTEFLSPAVKELAKMVDQSIIGQYTSFLGNQYGQIDGLSSSTAKSYLLGARQVMNVNLAPEEGRNMLWTPVSETAALSTDMFLQAYSVGDSGEAMRRATLGTKLGWDNYMSQLVPGVPTTATNLVAGTGVTATTVGVYGATTVTVSGLTAAVPAGSWCTIDNRPYRVVSSAGGATPTAITIAAPGLVATVAIGSSVKCYTAGAVNLVAGYDVGHSGKILVDGFTNFPSVGQLITFGTSSTSPTYTIIQANSTAGTIALDRPLEVALANDVTANAGPAGQFNFGFHRNAIALVSRPLAVAPSEIGTKQAVINYNGLSMRVSFSYDSVKQGVRVTVDMLYGVKVLDTNLGVVMLG